MIRRKLFVFPPSRDKHRDKEHHRDKAKHSSKSSHDHHRERDREKKATENGVSHNKAEQVAIIKEELRDPLDNANFSFSETNAIQANGIRECFVNVSQISETSSCDYSMSQFRADESAFYIKSEAAEADDDNSQESAFGNDTLDSQDDEDVPIAQRKKIKREISDDEDEMPLTARKKQKTEKKEKKIKREPSDGDEEDDYDKPKKKKIKKDKV